MGNRDAAERFLEVEVLRVLHGMRDLEDLLPFLDEEV
jgi:hypothetical protein